jgi:TRAP-type C4-dicarboxylate transport system permease large subunit
MSGVLATIISGSTVVKLVIGALIAGVGVTVAFSGLIYCIERAVASRRSHRRTAAAAYQAVSALALASVIAIVTYGLILTTTKPK